MSICKVQGYFGSWRGIYGPRSVKLTWNESISGGVGEKRRNKCLNELQVSGMRLVVVSLCSLNS